MYLHLEEHQNRCQNKERCENIRIKKEKAKSRFYEQWQDDLDSFIAKLNKNQAQVMYHSHYEKRSIERVVNHGHVLSVLQEGEVIDRQNRYGEIRFVVMSYIKSAPKVYRPIHVIAGVLDENHWYIVTAYNPESHPWKWNEFLDERICFCSKRSTQN